MKKKLFIIGLLSVLFVMSADGQNSTLGQENDFVFSDAGAFCNGLARVKFGEKWGFINNLGNIVVNFDYEEAKDFKDGFAEVKKNGKWGFIDKSGKIVVPIKYEKTCPFYEGLAGVKQNGKWGFVDMTGRIAVDIKYEPNYNEDHHFKNGYAAVCLSSDRGSYGVLIDKHGNIKTPTFKYARISDYCDGLAKVTVVYLKDGERAAKYGYINIHGEEIIKPQYSDADDFVNGYATVVKDEKSGIINKYGNVEVDFKYSPWTHYIHQGGMATFKTNKKAVLVDMKGKVLIPPIYNYISIDKKGSTDLIIVIGSNEKCGWININNKVVVPLKYDNSCHYINGYAAVAINDKWGVINKTGQVILPLKYDIVNKSCFSDGYCMVKLNGNCGFIDKLGKTLQINLGKDEMYEVGKKREREWDGTPSTTQYLTSAFDWFKKSALKGNEHACFKVGYYNFMGLIGKRNFVEAVKWLEKSINPNNTTNGKEYVYLGVIYNEGGFGITKNEDKAIKYYKDGALLMESGDCYNQLAYVYAKKKNYNLALNYVDKAIQVSLDDNEKANFYDTKGEIYLMMGEDEEALKMWKKVLMLNPKYLDDYPQGTELYNTLKAKGKIN